MDRTSTHYTLANRKPLGKGALFMRKLIRRILGKERIDRWIAGVSTALDVDLLRIAHNTIGVLNYHNSSASGEDYVIEYLLPQIVPAMGGIIFDVGANSGEMSLRYSGKCAEAKVMAFEPNPITFATLTNNLSKIAKVACFNIGLGDRPGKAQLHCYRETQQSGHATIYKDMFEFYKSYGIEQADDIISFEFDVSTLDAFCKESEIKHIDFLKVDVEGHELNVLRGAANLLAGGCIKAIQFEFNECNVLSRSFLKDFYDLLNGFRFFRLNQQGLVDLGSYTARNEIFLYQNIVALRRDCFIDKVEAGTLQLLS